MFFQEITVQNLVTLHSFHFLQKNGQNPKIQVLNKKILFISSYKPLNFLEKIHQIWLRIYGFYLSKFSVLDDNEKMICEIKDEIKNFHLAQIENMALSQKIKESLSITNLLKETSQLNMKIDNFLNQS